jgi:hypothetical protein
MTVEDSGDSCCTMQVFDSRSGVDDDVVIELTYRAR